MRVYLARYDYDKWITMWRKNWGTWRIKIFDDWWLYVRQSISQVKMIKDFEIFNDSKILIGAGNKLANEFTLKNVVFLLWYVFFLFNS